MNTATQTPATVPQHTVSCSGGCGRIQYPPPGASKAFTWMCKACCAVEWQRRYPPPVKD